MNFEEWARLNEELASMTPTQKLTRVNQLNFGSDTDIVYKTLGLEIMII